MKLICGLGNPGKEYEKTRHNSGFMVIDAICNKLGNISFSEKSNALIAKTNINGENVLLMKPLTYMNESGHAVSPVANYYHLDLKDILIIHDDMDLPVGSVRIRAKGSSGGQKGMKSIIEQLGTDDITRIRVGVGHSQRGVHEEVPDWVLSPVPKSEQGDFNTAIDMSAKAAIAWVNEPLQTILSKYNIRKNK